MSKMNRAGSGGTAGPVNLTALSKPVPMKLFAAWEVDRTPSNCIPRYFHTNYVVVIKLY